MVMVFKICKICDKNRQNPRAFPESSFILRYVSCALCWQDQAIFLFSLPHSPPPLPPFLGKTCCIFPSKLCFQLHYISPVLSMQKEASRIDPWLVPTGCHSKLYLVLFSEKGKGFHFLGVGLGGWGEMECEMHSKCSDFDSWWVIETKFRFFWEGYLWKKSWFGAGVIAQR